MSFIKCNDVAQALIEEADLRFGDSWVRNSDKEKIFKQLCEMVDLIVKEFNAKSLEVQIDETTTDIIISITCANAFAQNKKHVFYNIINHSKSISFSIDGCNDGLLNIRFVFVGIWEKVKF